MNLQESLQWRYDATRMNGHTIPQEKLNAIMEATRLAPSSMDLQPYTILVISSIKIKSELSAIVHNHPLINQSSHLLVFAAWNDITLNHIHEHISNTAAMWKIPEESLHGLKGMLLTTVQQPREENFSRNAQQAYIALGIALVSAAEQQIDATPVEGVNYKVLDQFLGIKSKGLRSVALVALGFRDVAADHLAHRAKIRRQKEKMFVVPQLKEKKFDMTLLL